MQRDDPRKSMLEPDFQLLFESAPGLYLVLLPDLTIVAASNNYLSATMRRREDLIGVQLFEAFPDNPDDAAATGVANLRASINRVLKTRLADAMAVQKYDIARPSIEGGGFEERFWSPINSPVLGPDQQILYIIHRVEDVTEFVRAQREGSEHSKAADELRSRMEKMEAEIYSRSRQLEEMNRQRLEAIGRLAGGVAHDFNNLLGVILGYSRLLAERLPENGSFRGGLEKIEHAAESAASLTRQLLAFSRRQILEPKVIDLNQVVADVEPLIRRVIGADITFETNLASSLWNVKADPAQVEQVIMNLALNARDAMPDGGRLVIETSKAEIDEKYIQRRPTVPPGHYTMLSVADTGSGIPLEVQAHIFEPFFTTKEKGKGTGLGLATVYGIVKQSGGHVWVYSEPGMGTAFRIYLPATEATAEITNQRVASSPRLQGSETILVVDDHADLRDLAGLILKQSGYAVLMADTPAAALHIARSHSDPIDLLLTDVILPGMNGRILAQQLLALRPSAKVLFASGYTENVIAHHGELEPGTNFLQKPFSLDTLTRKVREVLDQA